MNDLTPGEIILIQSLRWVKRFLKTNTFWLVTLGMILYFGQSIDAEWLDKHLSVKTWLIPSLAALAYLVKIIQMRSE